MNRVVYAKNEQNYKFTVHLSLADGPNPDTVVKYNVDCLLFNNNNSIMAYGMCFRYSTSLFLFGK